MKQIKIQFNGKICKERMPELFEGTRDFVEKWVNDKTNHTNKKDLEKYDEGKWIFYIECKYPEGKPAEAVSEITIGMTEQDISNNPSFESFDDDVSFYFKNMEEYIEEL